MATKIYSRDDNGNIVGSWCDAAKLQGLLAQGYVVDLAELEVADQVTLEEPTVAELDRWDGYRNQEIRDLAKEAGIEGYDTARISNLKAALDAQE